MKNQIVSLSVKTFKIKGIEILPQAIGEVVIYESIQNPGILGTLTIADWQGLDEVGEVFAGDDFEIVFSTEESEELSLKYKLYASELKVDPSQSFNTTTYRFCSTWLIDGLTRQISKHYKDKYIHEIIEDLLSECGAKIGTIEKTKQKLNHFTTPLWTTVHSISHLCSFAINDSSVGGYVLWTDLKTDKVNCTTVDYMYQGKLQKLEKPFTTISENERYENKITNLNFESNFDIIRFVNQGLSKTRYDGYFHDKNEVFSTKENITEIPHKHLSYKLPLNAEYLDKKYDSIHSCMLYPSTDSLANKNQYTDLVEGYMKYRYVNLFSDVFKINLLVNPTSIRRVGALCKLDYQSQDRPKTKTDGQYTGDYVIRDIRHSINSGSYFQVLTIIGDGFKMSERNLIKWKPDAT